ncbi:MAG TPA: PH domain-containing protein [Pyrinomonadaceae bacterium]|jgi:uncharacterized membrane protein YdbT with pleckstrin-like domain|nr:PH domain-containing protein [Pyrinomonadaceae bacterium]
MIDGGNREQDDIRRARVLLSICPTLKFVYIGYAVAVLAAFLQAMIIAAILPVVGPIPVVVIGILIICIPVYWHLKKKMIRYTVTENALIIDKGLFSRTIQTIPLDRIQDVTVTASFGQRILKIGTVIIDNASEDQGKTEISSIDNPERFADAILGEIHRRDQ